MLRVPRREGRSSRRVREREIVIRPWAPCGRRYRRGWEPEGGGHGGRPRAVPDVGALQWGANEGPQTQSPGTGRKGRVHLTGFPPASPPQGTWGHARGGLSPAFELPGPASRDAGHRPPRHPGARSGHGHPEQPGRGHPAAPASPGMRCRAPAPRGCPAPGTDPRGALQAGGSRGPGRASARPRRLAAGGGRGGSVRSEQHGEQPGRGEPRETRPPVTRVGPDDGKPGGEARWAWR